MSNKVYVDVIAEFKREGLLKPLVIKWKDGRAYKVVKVLRCTAAGKSVRGSCGLLYTCLVSGKEVNLYYEEMYASWFVEGRGRYWK